MIFEKYAQYQTNLHTIAASSPLQTFSFFAIPVTAFLLTARIAISPSTATNVRVSIGFFDDTSTYRSLFWATGSDTTAITLPFPLQSIPTQEVLYGVVNSSASAITLIAYYSFIYT